MTDQRLMGPLHNNPVLRPDQGLFVGGRTGLALHHVAVPEGPGELPPPACERGYRPRNPADFPVGGGRCPSGRDCPVVE